MAKRRRTYDRTAREPGSTGTTEVGSGPLVGQLGLFETANGLPAGPVAILLAVAAAVVLIPITRLVRAIARR